MSGEDPISGLNRKAQEAAWRAASTALKDHAGDSMGLVQRTAIVGIVSDAAIKAYLAEERAHER